MTPDEEIQRTVNRLTKGQREAFRSLIRRLQFDPEEVSIGKLGENRTEEVRELTAVFFGSWVFPQIARAAGLSNAMISHLSRREGEFADVLRAALVKR